MIKKCIEEFWFLTNYDIPHYFRYNARGFDLNRNFPDYFKQNNKRSQPETEAVKEWLSKIQFVLSGNIHGGALVGSYPFDNTPNSIFSSVLSSPSLTPDDDTFKHLAATYSLNHGRMYLGDPCKVEKPFFENLVWESNTQPFFQPFAIRSKFIAFFNCSTYNSICSSSYQIFWIQY